MTQHFDYDLMVIGAGSGGVRAARKSAEFGARVAVVEEAALGGTCVNVGCIPKKLYVYASEYAAAWRDSAGFGWQTEGVSFDWNTLRDNKTKEVARLNAIYARLLEAPGVDIIEGHGVLAGPQEVVVGESRYRAGKILLATGTWPAMPEIPGIELALTSNEIFDVERFPERLLIVGGGYIATEFASIFSGLGANVVQSYRGELFLRGFDHDIRQFLSEEMRKAGVDLRFNHHVTALESQPSGVIAHLSDGREPFDAVLYATGRRPNIAQLGLEHTGVTLTEAGYIEVDDAFQTSRTQHLRTGGYDRWLGADAGGHRRGNGLCANPVWRPDPDDGLPRHPDRGVQSTTHWHGGTDRRGGSGRRTSGDHFRVLIPAAQAYGERQ
jgi:glutathione reductase (NADPH)